MSLPHSPPVVLLLLGAARLSTAVPWEWAATFDLNAGHYTWSFTKGTAGTYPDASCRIIILPAESSAEASLEAVEASAESKWGAGADKTNYGELETGEMYTLQLSDHTWTSHFIIHVDTAGAYAVFLEHSPFEFENGFHFLQDDAGKDVEPVVEEMAGHGHDHGGHDGHDHGGHDGHDHGGEGEISCPWDKAWEWAGVFPVSAGVYDWNAQKVDGAYADADMKIVVMASEGTLEDADAMTMWDNITDALEVEAGQNLPIGRGSKLHFEQASWASHYRIKVPPGTSHLAIFAQHIPTEFESKYHYLRSATGMDIEPVLEESVLDCKEEKVLNRWGEVIIGSFITVLPTLLSLAVIARIFVPMLKTISEDNLVVKAIKSFASGVIFAAAVFLLLPEGLHLVAVGKTEAAATGAWGTTIMSSWFICVLMKHGVHFLVSKVGRVTVVSKVGRGTDEEDEEVAQGADWKVVLPVLFGDFFHNFSDGLVIGVAFKVCGPAFGWKLIGITVLHEAPQEISDFAVMVTKGRMHWGKATLLNFLSGLSTVLGAIITYAAAVDYAAEGAILAFGAGVYLFVALSELGPVVSELQREEGLKGSIARLLAFAVGAILIGLVLLDHEHCFAESADGEDPHAGHNHGGSEAAEEDPHAGHNHR